MPISKKKIIDAILNGINTAFDEYEEMSGGCWLSAAPEHYVVCKIAESLSKLDGAKYITMEGGVKDTLNEAGAVSVGRPKKALKVNGRADIIFWNGNEEPRGIIEVKNPLWTMHEKAMDDVARIVEMLRIKSEESSLEFGAFAFYTACDSNSKTSSEEGIKNKLARMLEKVREKYDANISLHHSKIITVKNCSDKGPDVDCSWVAACFLISF